jgi:16S rRNA (guanine1516-N2)-methyltransferase
MSRFRVGCDEEGYYLEDTFSRQHPLRVNFSHPEFLTRLRGSGKKSELVARAVKAGAGVRVLDCTAGLARDAFVLAHLGCEVALVERSSVVSTLLLDGLRRARQVPELASAANRIKLTNADSLALMAQTGLEYDVIYIDPMFPEKQGAAAVRGPMQHLQRFLGPDEDAKALLSVALQSGCSRVVLKRPPHGDWLSPITPTHVFKNKNSRYEVFAR